MTDSSPTPISDGMAEAEYRARLTVFAEYAPHLYEQMLRHDKAAEVAAIKAEMSAWVS